MPTTKYFDPISGTWKYVLQGPKGEKGETGSGVINLDGGASTTNFGGTDPLEGGTA